MSDRTKKLIGQWLYEIANIRPKERITDRLARCARDGFDPYNPYGTRGDQYPFALNDTQAKSLSQFLSDDANVGAISSLATYIAANCILDIVVGLEERTIYGSTINGEVPISVSAVVDGEPLQEPIEGWLAYIDTKLVDNVD